jgi:hypothetical protein
MDFGPQPREAVEDDTLKELPRVNISICEKSLYKKYLCQNLVEIY